MLQKKINYIMILLAVILLSEHSLAQRDSLQSYLELAAQNNPSVKSDFLLYQASLQKIPQAGAYPDPQFDMGVFLQPMEIIDGKQVANFNLMQMFPWFGTRKAARNEATEMTRMSYEKFRESRDNLFFEVKSQWYVLCNLQQRLKNVRENRELLLHLEELALSRFSATRSKGGTAATTTLPTESPAATPATGGMSGMSASPGVPPTEPMQNSSMNTMGDAGGMGGSSSGMSDVLRIQLEIAELDNEAESILSEIRAQEAKFNTLLNRPVDLSVHVPDSIVQVNAIFNDQTNLETMIAQNPMLGMITAEGLAYKAKAEMDQKMSYPMFGIGAQYMLISKRMDMEIPVTEMNGKDMIMPMFTMTLPLYRKKYNAQQTESRLMRQATEEKYTNTVNALEAEYALLRHQMADAARKIALYKKQSALAQTTYDLIIKEFSAGMSDLTNVIQVQRQLLDYQLKKSTATANYNTMVATLDRLLSESRTE